MTTRIPSKLASEPSLLAKKLYRYFDSLKTEDIQDSNGCTIRLKQLPISTEDFYYALKNKGIISVSFSVFKTTKFTPQESLYDSKNRDSWRKDFSTYCSSVIKPIFYALLKENEERIREHEEEVKRQSYVGSSRQSVDEPVVPTEVVKPEAPNDWEDYLDEEDK